MMHIAGIQFEIWVLSFTKAFTEKNGEGGYLWG